MAIYEDQVHAFHPDNRELKWMDQDHLLATDDIRQILRDIKAVYGEYPDPGTPAGRSLRRLDIELDRRDRLGIL